MRLSTFLTISLGLLAPGVSAADGLTVEVRSRRPTPGEPLRILACGAGADVRVSGSFLGRAVAFGPPGPDGCRVGWTMVPLDREPGIESVEVSAGDAGGGLRYASRAIEIEDYPFPEERLEVAPGYVEPPPAARERIARERELLARVYRTRSAFAVGPAPFVRPVPGPPTSVFGTRRFFNDRPRDPHPGLDLRAPTGTPVRNGADGRVVLARDLYYAGNTVIVDHGGGLFTIYAHLSRIDATEGNRVEAGTVVGLSGATGRVTGPHLHWGAKIGDEPFDPAALLDPDLFR